MADDEKKIIVDDDWKQEAKKEKEKLAEEEKTEKQHTDEENTQGHGPLPKGDFAALISMLTTQAFYAMGVLNVEGQQDREPDLLLAKYNIDMLETVEEKTKGNLDDQESKILTETLSQLRMVYVQVSGS